MSCGNGWVASFKKLFMACWHQSNANSDILASSEVTTTGGGEDYLRLPNA
jgi:hypothetical protein